MRHPFWQREVTREELLRWYRESIARTAELFAIPVDDAYYDRPIPLRNPIVFYEGHLPAFMMNTVIKRALGEAGIDAGLEDLFARGIDPASEAGVTNQRSLWPDRRTVQEYGQEASRRFERALRTSVLEDPDQPLLRNGESVFTILEHEQMHQETLLYIFHNMPWDRKNRREPPANISVISEAVASKGRVHIPAGSATLGSERAEGFGWDNEFPAHRVDVAALEVDRHNVTNDEFLEFIGAGGYRNESLWSPSAWTWLQESGHQHPHYWQSLDGQWFWRGMFEPIPLPGNWPVYATHAEAEAYVRWRGGRLMSEAEYHRAAFGTPDGHERRYPWGDELPDGTRGNFGFRHWEPVPVGSFPAGASGWGIHDLVGNGWEWTSSLFEPFAGFEPMPSYPEYSADFFDQHHFVLKGASPATAPELIRRSFRNWFRPEYPYVYATFRCAY